MIKRFSPNNAARFRQKSLEELNEVTAALDSDISQIVEEVDAVEATVQSVSFDGSGVVVTTGITVAAAGNETES